MTFRSKGAQGSPAEPLALPHAHRHRLRAATKRKNRGQPRLAPTVSLLLDPAHRDVPVVLVAPEVPVCHDELAEVVPPLPVDFLLLGVPVLPPDRLSELLPERERLVLGPLERGRIPPYGDADPANRSRPQVGQGVVHVGDDIVLVASARGADGAAELAGEHLAVDGVRHAVEDRL